MRKQTFMFVSWMALVASCNISAQNMQIGYSTFGPIGPMDSKPVTGAPYSATAITTSTQTLADGTHITHTIQAQMARDSAGRTRREETLKALGPWSTGGSEQHLVSINDPVAQTHYVLRPDQQVAMKVGLPSLSVGTGPGMAMVVGGSMAAAPGPAVAGIKVRQGFEEGSAKVKTFSVGDDTMFIAKEGMVSTAGAVMMVRGSDDKAQVEDLGDQVMEGVRAHGRREKRTIAVGEIGNDRPIDVTSETWFSDELQTIVLSKRTDPRIGDSEFRLTNISRTEPAASLFEVPAGYTLKDESKGRE